MGEYTTKDIILGTKDKLGELSRKLKRLGELTCITRDKRVHYVDYDISVNKDKKPEVRCNVNEKFWGISGRLRNSKFYKNFNSHGHGSESALISRDNNGTCYISNDRYKLFIPNMKQEEFGNIVDEILGDEFTSNLSNIEQIVSQNENNIKQDILTAPEHIIIGKLGKVLSFYPGKNVAIFQTFDGFPPRNYMIEDMLKVPVDDKDFTDYIIELIESTKARKKEIIIPKFNPDSYNINFNVEEDEKGITLIKK